MEITLKDQELKAILEEVLLKIMMEKRELFKEIVEEVIEDVALSKAIDEGRKGDFVSKDEIMEMLSK
jgi:hypothetical protein